MATNTYFELTTDTRNWPGFRLPLNERGEFAAQNWQRGLYISRNGIASNIPSSINYYLGSMTIGNDGTGVSASYSSFAAGSYYFSYRDATLSVLNPLVSGGTTFPMAIVGNGSIVGTATTADQNRHAVFYYPTIDGFITTDLSTLAGTGSSVAADIVYVGDNRWVVGYSDDEQGVRRAVLWTITLENKISGPNRLELDLSQSDVPSAAFAINNKKQIAGARNNKPVIFDLAKNIIIEISSPDFTIASGAALDINDNGDAVGWYRDENDIQKGFLFHQDTFYDLTNILIGLSGTERVTLATTINNSLTIAGTISINGSPSNIVAFVLPNKPYLATQINLPYHLDNRYGTVNRFSGSENAIAILDSKGTVFTVRNSRNQWIFERVLEQNNAKIVSVFTDGEYAILSLSDETKVYVYDGQDWKQDASIPSGSAKAYRYMDTILIQKYYTPPGNNTTTTSWIEVYKRNSFLEWMLVKKIEPVTGAMNPFAVYGDTLFVPNYAGGYGVTAPLGTFYKYDGGAWNEALSLPDTFLSNNAAIYAINNTNLAVASYNAYTGIGISAITSGKAKAIATLNNIGNPNISVINVATNDRYVVAQFWDQIRVYKNQQDGSFWGTDYVIPLSAPNNRSSGDLQLVGNRVFVRDGNRLRVFLLCETACPALPNPELKTEITVYTPQHETIKTLFTNEVFIKNGETSDVTNNRIEIKYSSGFEQAPEITGDVHSCVRTQNYWQCQLKDLGPGTTAHILLSSKTPTYPGALEYQFLFDPGINILEKPVTSSYKTPNEKRVTIFAHEEPVPVVQLTPSSNTVLHRFDGEKLYLPLTIENWLETGNSHEFRWWIDGDVNNKKTESNTSSMDISFLAAGEYDLSIELLSAGLPTDWGIYKIHFRLEKLSSTPHIAPFENRTHMWFRESLNASLVIGGLAFPKTEFTIRWTLDGEESTASPANIFDLSALGLGDHTLSAKIFRGERVVRSVPQVKFSVINPFDVSLSLTASSTIDINANHITIDVQPKLTQQGPLSGTLFFRHTIPNQLELEGLPDTCSYDKSTRTIQCPLDDQQVYGQSVFQLKFATNRASMYELIFQLVGSIQDTNPQNDNVAINVTSLRPSIDIRYPVGNTTLKLNLADSIVASYALYNVEGIEDNISVWWRVDDGKFTRAEQINVGNIEISRIRDGEHSLDIELRSRNGNATIASQSVNFGVYLAGSIPSLPSPSGSSGTAPIPYVKIVAPENGETYYTDISRVLHLSIETNYVSSSGTSMANYILFKNGTEVSRGLIDDSRPTQLKSMTPGSYRVEVLIVDQSGTLVTVESSNFIVNDFATASRVETSRSKTFYASFDLAALFVFFVVLSLNGRRRWR